MRLPIASADTGNLVKAVMAALAAVWRPGFRYKEAGTVFLDLMPAADLHGGFFDCPDNTRSKALMTAIDRLNGHYGRATVGYGTAGERQAWTLRRKFISPRYTTSWVELLHV